MKRSILTNSLALLALALLLPGCLDIWFTTRINADGSIEQIIVFQGDSTEIADAPLALMKQEGWQKEWTQPEKDKHKLTVSKKFQSVEAFNAALNPADSSLLVIRVNATLKKKFRWFFTRFEYAETVKKADPFNHLNYKDFLSDEEVRIIAMDEDAREKEPDYDSTRFAASEKRFEEFIMRSIYEDFYLTLVDVLKNEPGLILSPDVIIAQKDGIFRHLVDTTKGSETGDILEGIHEVVNHPDLLLIRDRYADRFNRFQNKLAFFETASDDNYRFTIRMPGLLLQTNSDEISGPDITWDIDYYDFFFRDRTMTAESRVVNVWAFVVAGVILLVAMGGLIGTALRSRRKN